MTDDKPVALNFFVSGSLKRRLRAFAQRHGLSVSAAVRLLLTQALDREERAGRDN